MTHTAPPHTPYPSPRQPPVDPLRTTPVETTRLLAAGTYLNEGYRERVLDATVRDPTRFVCPSFGVDIATVVRHALVAHRRTVVRNAFLLLDLLALLVALLTAARQEAPSRRTGGDVFGGGFDPPVAQDTGGGHAGLAVVLLLLVAWVILFTDAMVRQQTLWEHLLQGRDPASGPVPAGAAATAWIRSMQDLAQANLVVFAAQAPFVGSGGRMDGGTAAIHLQGVVADPDDDDPDDDGRDRRRVRRTPVPFGERELLDRLTTALRTLDLPGLRVQERLYVNGAHAASALHGRLLRGGAVRPTAYAEGVDVAAALADPMGPARLYLCAETTGWHGQLVSTTFIRVVKFPELLYVESSAYALPPLLPVFGEVDTLNLLSNGWRILNAAWEATRRTVPALVLSPVGVGRAVADSGRAGRRLARHRAALRQHIRIDQGAVTSVRQAASGARLGQYFVEQDLVLHIKAVAARLAEVLQEFLGEHGYDIGELDFGQPVSFTTINNGGYIGAVGTNATGTVQTAAAAVAGRPSSGGQDKGG